jgi:hypothetical protein
MQYELQQNNCDLKAIDDQTSEAVVMASMSCCLIGLGAFRGLNDGVPNQKVPGD